MSAEVQITALMLEWEFREESDALECKPREHTHRSQAPPKKKKKKIIQEKQKRFIAQL